MKIDKLGEFGLIDMIYDRFKSIKSEGVIGMGDDCAIIPMDNKTSFVITTDMLVEGVHFLKDKISPFDLGYKSLAVNLSDIAAMGAQAHSFFLSISLPQDSQIEWCDQFFQGLRSHNVELLGGDTVRSNGEIVINITAIGKAENKAIKRRSTAKVGDKIYVTSTLGDSAAGLQAILSNSEELYSDLVSAHVRPRPHLEEGKTLSALVGVNSMIDISDGLASDISQILKATGTDLGAEIDLDRIPTSEAFNGSPWASIELALTGGEDYCLLFTADADLSIPSSITAYEVGMIVKDDSNSVKWIKNAKEQKLFLKGFTHF